MASYDFGDRFEPSNVRWLSFGDVTKPVTVISLTRNTKLSVEVLHVPNIRQSACGETTLRF